jgi:hypothetical protein
MNGMRSFFREIVLLNFRPKQTNEWIGDIKASLFELFSFSSLNVNLGWGVHYKFSKEEFSKELPTAS